jgi:hypothetical protein
MRAATMRTATTATTMIRMMVLVAIVGSFALVERGLGWLEGFTRA